MAKDFLNLATLVTHSFKESNFLIECCFIIMYIKLGNIVYCDFSQRINMNLLTFAQSCNVGKEGYLINDYTVYIVQPNFVDLYEIFNLLLSL